MGGNERDLTGIIGIDPNGIKGEADTARQASIDGIGEGDEPTLAEVWDRDRRLADRAEEAGATALNLTLLEEAFPGIEIFEG